MQDDTPNIIGQQPRDHECSMRSRSAIISRLTCSGLSNAEYIDLEKVPNISCAGKSLTESNRLCAGDDGAAGGCSGCRPASFSATGPSTGGSAEPVGEKYKRERERGRGGGGGADPEFVVLVLGGLGVGLEVLVLAMGRLRLEALCLTFHLRMHWRQGHSTKVKRGL